MTLARHILLSVALGLCLIVALVSCRMSAPKGIPARDVLRQAITNNALLDSVGLKGDVRFSSDALSGTLVFDGGLQNGATAWWLRGDLSLTHSSPVEHSAFIGAITAFSLDHRSLAVRIDSAHGILGDRLMNAVKRSDTAPWLVLTFDTGAVALPSRTRISADVVSTILDSLVIVSASPLTRQSFGNYEYRISVEAGANSEVPTQGWKGDLRIDGTTYDLLSVRWVPLGEKALSSLSLDLIDVQFDPRITVQKPVIDGAIVSMTIQSLTDIILGNPLVP